MCGIVLLITVVIAYLGKRIPDYSMFRRLGITKSDFRKMVVFEAGVSYLASIVIGTIIGLCTTLGFRYWVINRLDLGVELGKASVALYIAIYITTLFLYFLGFLLVKELEADFRLVTNTQETARIEKMVGRIPAVKIAVGLVLCVYSGFAYSKLHNHESSLFILAFFVGFYLLCKNSSALYMKRVQKHNPKKYYKRLVKNNRFYFRYNTVSRYALFFSVVCFIGCFICGGQIIGTLTAQDPENLYPYDFVCIADNDDETFFKDLTKDYDVDITEFPMVRVSNIDKTEKLERGLETPPQGQQIGISETTYHKLKMLQDPSYEPINLNLDENGDYVYIVHQQDTSTKAQPVDWNYGRKSPTLHIGIPCIWADEQREDCTYYKKKIAGEEIGSLIGCLGTPKCENIIVLSDDYFKIAQNEWKDIDALSGYHPDMTKQVYQRDPYLEQGPTKLVLMNVDDKDVKAIDEKLESIEDRHNYIGRFGIEDIHIYIKGEVYDSSVKFHYSKGAAIKDLKTERTMKVMVNIYIIAVLIALYWIMLFESVQMERKEKARRSKFLSEMGMLPKEIIKLNRRELNVYYVISTLALAISSAVFLKTTFIARMFSNQLLLQYTKLYLSLFGVWVVINGIYFFILSRVVGRKVFSDENK